MEKKPVSIYEITSLVCVVILSFMLIFQSFFFVGKNTGKSQIYLNYQTQEAKIEPTKNSDDKICSSDYKTFCGKLENGIYKTILTNPSVAIKKDENEFFVRIDKISKDFTLQDKYIVEYVGNFYIIIDDLGNNFYSISVNKKQ